MKKIILCLILQLTFNFCSASILKLGDTDLIRPDDYAIDKTQVLDKYEKGECICPKYPKPVDCEEVLANGNNESGIYTIFPRSRVIECESMEVFCDMETDGGGWTVIQRRGDYKNAENYFVKKWKTYKTGFGNLNKEFWLGNDNIHALTNQALYSVRFDLRKMDGSSAFALYDNFWIENEEDKYRLYLQEYSGNTGNAIGNHHKAPFYTLDQPNFPEGRKSGDKQHVGGWWLNTFPSSNLNGLNKRGKDVSGQGILWFSFGGSGESLAATEIKIRSKKFKN